MNNLATTFIPLAKIVRVHGLIKNGNVSFKCELYSRGGDNFKDRQVVYVENIALSLSEAPAPLGGKWGEARAVILSLHESVLAAKNFTAETLIGKEVGYPRAEFKNLAAQEFYVIDFIGAALFESAEAPLRVGKIISVADFSAKGIQNLNYVAETPSGRRFEFPVGWVDVAGSSPEKVVAPGVSDWIELESGNSKKPDDADDSDEARNSGNLAGNSVGATASSNPAGSGNLRDDD